MQETNLLDRIESPTASISDFVWFVAKWSVVWVVVSFIVISGMQYFKHLITGEPDFMTPVHGTPILYLIFIFGIILLALSYYTILRQAANTLNYDFVKNWKVLLFLMFVILFTGVFLYSLCKEIGNILYYFKYKESHSMGYVQKLLRLTFVCIAESLFTSSLFSPILLLFHKNLKKQPNNKISTF